MLAVGISFDDKGNIPANNKKEVGEKPMSEFPEKLSGAELEALRQKALAALSEERIGYLKEMMYAMVNLYGIIPVRKAYEILTDNYGEDISEEAFLDFCEYVRHEQNDYFYIFGEEEYDESCTDPASEPMDRLISHEAYLQFDDSYYDLMKLKAGKPWYIPAKEKLEEYKEDAQIEKNEQYYAFIDFMKSEFNLSADEAEERSFDALCSLRMENHSIDLFLDSIQRFSHINITFEKAKKIVPCYIELNNNTRMPGNNGFTPVEAEKLRDEYGFESDTCYVSEIELDEAREKERSKNAKEAQRSLEEMRRLFNEYALSELKKNPPAKSKKIGRNEPCPCGSGKKYKKCCGMTKKPL